eukprot:comp24135_c4_seq1/m.43850 comp24135_c4_seq1/g.43850  ORF comp24135_c4_seq1/g.43850 comp24135_c4_seq1/m.43850 type:complete len:131 (+) comp24135_c4_seq1:1083-1475(+)
MVLEPEGVVEYGIPIRCLLQHNSVDSEMTDAQTLTQGMLGSIFPASMGLTLGGSPQGSNQLVYWTPELTQQVNERLDLSAPTSPLSNSAFIGLSSAFLSDDSDSDTHGEAGTLPPPNTAVASPPRPHSLG